MTVIPSTYRVSPIAAACVAGSVLATAPIYVSADGTVQGARVVATQRIPAAAIETIRPASVSGDGRLIAFVSRQGTSAQQRCQNVFVLDRSSGLITEESLASDGTPPTGDSQAPSLSADGEVVAFETLASNVGPDTARRAGLRIVVRDRRSSRWLTPMNVQAKPPNGTTSRPFLSGIGRTVVFTSDATDLVPEDDLNGPQTDVYRWQLEGRGITRVSVDGSGTQRPRGASHSPSVNRDGDLVAFVSTAALVPEDTNSIADVYLHSVREGQTSLISRGVARLAGNGASYSPIISTDGQYIAFVSKANDLVPGDRNEENDVYVYQMATGAIELVSSTNNGKSANGGSRTPALSADGRYVVYESMASNLGSGAKCPQPGSDTNLLADIYLFDRRTRCVTRVSGAPVQEWWTPSVAPAIDASARLVVFSSTQPATNQDLSTDFGLYELLLSGTSANVYDTSSTNGSIRKRLPDTQPLNTAVQ
jgi:Tol biopolymer transport system component